MVIKLLLASGLAVVSASAALAQTGGATGSYGAAAINSGQFAEAEHMLKPVSMTDAADPARLINIATVYTRTQRAAEARVALMRVQTLPAEQLDLANGTSYSSHVLAKAMLARLER